jgi:hypothetical protein
VTADRDTTLPRTPEQILSTLNLIGDKWLRERVLAALREARGEPCIPCGLTIAALRSERDALAARVEGMRAQGIEEAAALSGREGQSWIAARIRALASSGSAPVAPAREPYYLADGSAILLPREEVERLRRAAAKVIGAARELVEAAWDGDVAPGQGAWWGVNDGDFQPLANALDMLDTNDGDRAPVAPEGRETGAGGDIGPCACEQVSVIGSFVTTVDGVTHRRSTYCGPPPGVRAPAPETPAPEGTDAPRSLPVEGGHKLRANSGGSR